jgi:RNA polymerase sigma-70 factor (ECF subfamily)
MSAPTVDHRIVMLRARLAALARQQGLTSEDAKDAVQEAFSTLLRLRPPGDIDEARACADCPLLSTLVVNAARNMRRRHHRALPHLSGEALEALIDERPEPEALVSAAEHGRHLRGCLASLQDVQRKIVVLRLIEEVSGRDVARLLDITPGHVAVLLHRAKKELSSCMTMTAF